MKIISIFTNRDLYPHQCYLHWTSIWMCICAKNNKINILNIHVFFSFLTLSIIPLRFSYVPLTLSDTRGTKLVLKRKQTHFVENRTDPYQQSTKLFVASHLSFSGSHIFLLMYSLMKSGMSCAFQQWFSYL